MYKNLNESKLISSYNSKDTNRTFTKNANKDRAPRPSDIQKMIKSINKKGGK